MQRRQRLDQRQAQPGAFLAARVAALLDRSAARQRSVRLALAYPRFVLLTLLVLGAMVAVPTAVLIEVLLEEYAIHRNGA